jgi:glycosyltransferase involved in cell wall biosynthesis
MDSNSNLKPKVAIIGSRGIPNKYGGFEGFTERLSVEMVKRDCNVSVSCEGKRDVNCPKIYKGVNIFYFPLNPPQSSALRIFYEVFYDFYSLIWAARNVDYIYMLGYSAGIFFFIPHLFRKKLIVNPDGLEWKRSKFSSFIRTLLRINEKLMTLLADEIVADSKELKDYLDAKYGTNSKFIPYGVVEYFESSWDADKLPEKLQGKITKNNYWLIVARLEPENNIHTIIQGYLESKSELPLVVIGNYSSPKYQKLIEDTISQKADDKKIIFTGGIYQPDLLEMLRKNCFAYLHGHSVGGTNPSLLEAMIKKNLILAHNNQFNREVCQDSALYFDSAQKLSKIMANTDLKSEEYLNLKYEAYYRVKKEYSWSNIVEDYMGLFSSQKPALQQNEVGSTVKAEVKYSK